MAMVKVREVDSFPDRLVALNLLESFLYPEFEEISGYSPPLSPRLARGVLRLMLRETHTQLYLLPQAEAPHEAAILTLLLCKRFTTQSNQELNNISINLIILIEKL